MTNTVSSHLSQFVLSSSYKVGTIKETYWYNKASQCKPVNLVPIEEPDCMGTWVL